MSYKVELNGCRKMDGEKCASEYVLEESGFSTYEEAKSWTMGQMNSFEMTSAKVKIKKE